MSNSKISLGKGIDLSMLIDPATKGKDQTGGVPYWEVNRDSWLNAKWDNVVHPCRFVNVRGWILGSGSGSLHEELSISCHYGTHIDSKYHIDVNAPDLSQISFDTFYGNAVVAPLDITPLNKSTEITVSQLQELNLEIHEGDWILIFTKEYEESTRASINLSTSQWLIERGIKGVGVDASVYYSNDSHSLLHEKGLLTLEGLDPNGLRSIKGKRVFLVTAPLKVKGLGASPCRAMAFEYL